MVVMFEEHWPVRGEEFYELIYGERIDNLEPKGGLNSLYTVPYYIWINYNIYNVNKKLKNPGRQMNANYFGSYIL